MRILVFGADGQVGHELVRQASLREADVIAMTRATADLSQPGAAASAIGAAAPALVINAAAYTAVDRAESEPDLAHRINAAAPGEMAQTCALQEVPFLHVSTDYVFDGHGDRPWHEQDAVAPCNVYGASKLAGEQAVLAAGGAWSVLRTSWVFSAQGANFVRTMLRLGSTRAQLRVVDDQIGGPTPAAAIASALLRMGVAMKAGRPGGLYHFAGAPQISWAGFAREIFAQAGLSVAVEGIATRDYPTPAARPANSRLDCRRLAAEYDIAQPDWRAGLRDVLDELGVLA